VIQEELRNKRKTDRRFFSDRRHFYPAQVRSQILEKLEDI
jgi:hypothetical protein